jgi:hypothetical protein
VRRQLRYLLNFEPIAHAIAPDECRRRDDPGSDLAGDGGVVELAIVAGAACVDRPQRTFFARRSRDGSARSHHADERRLTRPHPMRGAFRGGGCRADHLESAGLRCVDADPRLALLAADRNDLARDFALVNLLRELERFATRGARNGQRHPALSVHAPCVFAAFFGWIRV